MCRLSVTSLSFLLSPGERERLVTSEAGGRRAREFGHPLILWVCGWETLLTRVIYLRGAP